jgi:hypothetical protein
MMQKCKEQNKKEINNFLIFASSKSGKMLVTVSTNVCVSLSMKRSVTVILGPYENKNTQTENADKH